VRFFEWTHSAETSPDNDGGALDKTPQATGLPLYSAAVRLKLSEETLSVLNQFRKQPEEDALIKRRRQENR